MVKPKSKAALTTQGAACVFHECSNYSNVKLDDYRTPVYVGVLHKPAPRLQREEVCSQWSEPPSGLLTVSPWRFRLHCLPPASQVRRHCRGGSAPGARLSGAEAGANGRRTKGRGPPWPWLCRSSPAGDFAAETRNRQNLK